MRLIFVAHGDHNFQSIKCKKQGDTWIGHMDNQIGVYSVLQAYFSGRLPQKCINIQITYGQEQSGRDKHGNIVSFVGARQVMQQIQETDLIVVVDVTSLPQKFSNLDFSIQKCKNKVLKQFLEQTFKKDFDYQIFQNTPDIQAFEDQTDAFREVTNNVFFFGIQVYGGDYNRIPVKCSMLHQQRAVQAMIRLANSFEQRWQYYEKKMPRSKKRENDEQYNMLSNEMKQLSLIKEYESDSEQQDDWKQMVRLVKFSKNKIIFKFNDKNYEDINNTKDYLNKLRKDSDLSQVLLKEDIVGNETLLIQIINTNTCKLFIKQIKKQKIFEAQLVKQAFLLQKNNKKAAVVSIKQKRISNMILYVKQS